MDLDLSEEQTASSDYDVPSGPDHPFTYHIGLLDIEVEKHHFWSQMYTIEIKIKEEPEKPGIAMCAGRFICRNDIRLHFRNTVRASPSRFLQCASENVFDKYGNVQEIFLTGKLRGRGTWDHKLNDKCILIFEDFFSPHAHLTEQSIRRLVDHAIDFHTEVGNIFVNPDMTQSTSPENTSVGVSRFRKAGFRRLGDSSWFCLSLDYKHPSRFVSAADDFDPPEDLAMQPLHLFEKELEQKKTRYSTPANTEDRSEEFRGFSDENIARLVTLQHIPQPVSPQQMLQLKYGCICGQCVAGFISPRMRFVLITNALKNVGMMAHMPWHRAYHQLIADLLQRNQPFSTKVLLERIPCSPGLNLDGIFNRLFEMSIKTDEKAGADTFQMFELKDEQKTAYKALPRCRNDSEYGFVRGMLEEM